MKVYFEAREITDHHQEGQLISMEITESLLKADKASKSADEKTLADFKKQFGSKFLCYFHECHHDEGQPCVLIPV